MDEKNELMELVQRLATALESITAKVDEMDSRINELDSVLYDGLIGPANEAIAQNEYDSALSDFRTKYAEKLGPYENACKSVEGDDFDLAKKAFDSYNEGGFEFSPDEYVDKLTAKLADQVEKIKSAVADQAGVDPKDVAVEVDAKTGETEVKVDDKTTEAKPEDKPAEVKEEEPKAEEPAKEDEDELAAFEKKLKEEMAGIDTRTRM